MGPHEQEIAAAIAAESGWMTEVLGDLVRCPTVLGQEEPGQAVMREAFRATRPGVPVDVPMDPAALRAHPAASPFDWDVSGKSNVVATWSPSGPARAVR